MVKKLKLSFNLNILNKREDLMGVNELKPLKFFILYSENSSFSAAYQTMIAPGMCFVCNFDKLSLVFNEINCDRNG
jgi:hypothetical protein